MVKLFHENITIEGWKMFLIGLVILVFNFVLFLAMWYVRRETVFEVGYPKRNKKYIKKRMRDYSFLNKIFLFKISRNAERKSFMLIINLVCHWLNLLSMLSCVVGFVSCMITLASGWALSLLVFPVLTIMLLTVLFEFIPHLIWLPSERRRYRFK